jgi:D-alanyl-D-alanine carboxypeptidase
MVVLDSVKNLNKTIWLYGSDRVGGQSLNVKTRAQFKTVDLLYASLMYSANNAANALYRATGFSRTSFIRRMNAKAAKLGAKNSNFIDPSGIGEKNISTAADMAKIARAAFGYKKISEITSAQEKTIIATIPRKNFYIKNTNKLVRDNDGSYEIDGSKTGFLGDDKVNLAVKIRTNAGNEVIVVIFGDRTLKESFANARMLAEWSWKNYSF